MYSWVDEGETLHLPNIQVRQLTLESQTVQKVRNYVV